MQETYTTNSTDGTTGDRRGAGRTYADLGLKLPGPIMYYASWATDPVADLGLKLPGPIMSAVAARAAQPAKTESPSLKNLMGWIVPQAQTRWLAAGVAWYTPQRCEMVFRQALAGDMQSQWEMFDLMEATWPELLTCLGQLKDEVVGSDVVTLHPFARMGQKPSEEAMSRQTFVQECLDTMRARADRDENDMDDTVKDLLDARGKGISILEIDWEAREVTGGAPATTPGAGAVPGIAIAPRCTRWVHPLWYGYPHGPGSGELMLRPGVGEGDAKKSWYPGDTSVGYGYAWGATPDWQDFPEHKFIIGICKARTGHPLASGLLHSLTFWWAAFNFTAEWFFVFAQINGQPFRWATYDPNMTPNDQFKLQAVLANMGANAWGMFPAGTTFELKEIAKNAGDNPNVALLEMANRVARLLILRQTLTADVGDKGGGSKALGEVHERVESGVVLACGRWAGRALNALARAICVLNFGDDKECPWFGPEQAGEDVEWLADVLYKTSQAGLEPTDEAIPEIGERLGFAVQRKAAAPAGPTVGQSLEQQRLEMEKRRLALEDQGQDQDAVRLKLNEEFPAASGKEQMAKGKGTEAQGARGELLGSEHPSDVIAARKAEVLGAAYRGAMAPFRQIILGSVSREECLTRLARAYADWSPQRLVSQLEEALELCAAAGAAEDKAEG